MTSCNNSRLYTLQLSQFCPNKLLLTNLWKGPTPGCSVSSLPTLFTCERLHRSAYPRSLWWRHISGLALFRIIPRGSVFVEAFPFSCGAPGLLSLLRLQPFSLGGLALLNALSLSLGWEMPFVVGLTAPLRAGAYSTHTEKGHAATSGWFLMGQKFWRVQWAGEMEL